MLQQLIWRRVTSKDALGNPVVSQASIDDRIYSVTSQRATATGVFFRNRRVRTRPLGWAVRRRVTGRQAQSSPAGSARRPGLDPASTRVLLVAASIGEGHNSSAAALAFALRRIQPGCELRTVDTFALMGGGTGPFFRLAYRLAVQVLPMMHELWYQAVNRLGAFRWFYRRVVGARVGRALVGEVVSFRPHVVVSTYPLGTAGLSWLRDRGLLDVPVVALLSDFAPHAFWVYPGVDEYFVLSDDGRDAMCSIAPGARVTVCAPPVAPAFHPHTPDEIVLVRERAGIPQKALTVLVSCGAMGLGSVTAAVDAVLAAGYGCHVVVVCGRNYRLQATLRRRRPRTDRLLVLGWVEDMATLMASVDVVVNNAGGMTAAEALACGRGLVMFRPVAGHGRASAAAMAKAGLAVVCTQGQELTNLLARWMQQPLLLRAAQERAVAHATAHRLEQAAQAVLRHTAPTAAGSSPRSSASLPDPPLEGQPL
jgi:UDP-N-acetylglucosamine:LPS N-acetylglucosamine transferase